MSENTNELGLREAAKKYGVDPQAIRYWIKQGTVRVTRPASGPGKSMSLDENSVLDALARYRPHLNRNNQNQSRLENSSSASETRPQQLGVGLREASRKYGVDVQTIRNWTKSGLVHILQNSEGRGKTMFLDEKCLSNTVQDFRPRRNRIGQSLPQANGGAPPSSQGGPSAPATTPAWRV